MNTNKVDYRSEMFRGLEMANAVTPSVIATALVAGTSAHKLAEAIANQDDIEKYRVELAHELQSEFVKRAEAEAKKAKKEA